MPTFHVRFRDENGVVVSRSVDASGRQDLATLLGVPPASVLRADEDQLGIGIKQRASHGPHITVSSLRRFCLELSVLLDAGIPLLEAIETLAEKSDATSVSGTLQSIVIGLKSGQPLSEALYSTRFDEMTIAIVSASERTGQLATSLRQHASYLGWLESLRSRLAKAAVYPLVLLGVGAAVVLFLLIFVLPRFAGVLEGFGNELPWTSQMLIHVSHFAEHYPWCLVAFGLFPMAIGGLAWRSDRVRRLIVQWSLQLPVVGESLHMVSLARLYRALGLLLSAGSPVVPSLRTVREVSSSYLHSAIDRAIEKVSQGARLSDALFMEGLTTPISDRMLRVGERTGQLARMCERASDFHDDEIIRLADIITDMINPALMLIVGVIVGGIIVLMYMPIFQLVEQLR